MVNREKGHTFFFEVPDGDLGLAELRGGRGQLLPEVVRRDPDLSAVVDPLAGAEGHRPEVRRVAALLKSTKS